jgi:DinB superfamily
MKLAAVILLLSTAAFAQEARNPVSNVLREMLPNRAMNTIFAIEKMPADKFDYKPTPEQMTFGHLAAHITDGNYFFCSNVGDVPRPKAEELQGTEGKDKLVAAVKVSFDFCTTALAKADDSKLNDNITWFDGKPRARAWAFVALASSWADHYGMAAMYLRLNGLLPPSVQKAKAEEKKPEEKKPEEKK